MYVCVCTKFQGLWNWIFNINFGQLMTCTTAPLHAIFSLFASLQHFYYALKIILPWRNQITRLSVSIETPRHIYHFSMIFIFIFAGLLNFFYKFCCFQMVALSTLSLLPLQHAITHQQFFWIRNSHHTFIYISLCVVLIMMWTSSPLHSALSLHILHKFMWTDTLFIYLKKKEREVFELEILCRICNVVV